MMLDTRCWLLVTGDWLPGYRMLVTGYWLPDVVVFHHEA